MLKYNVRLKHSARRLRREMTNSERALWTRLRRKQVLNIQFYRQKSIGDYIVDFYASQARIVVEVDGSQHMESDQEQKDAQRDIYLKNKGLCVLRFNNLQVLQELDSVMEVIYLAVKERMWTKNPPSPLFQRGKKT
ncbi:endonuclease domain-containing protein [bacterium]|nr:endonuclease domain-containing protein [bacterium]